MRPLRDKPISLHNGPVCPTCGARYLNTHQCSPTDLLRRAQELIDLAQRLPVQPDPMDRTAGCPCRPENGGSGVCGCIMGGPQITCSATDGLAIVTAIRKYERTTGR